jgi:hypothetical protein
MQVMVDDCSEFSPNKFTQQQEIDSCRTLSVGVARHLE